MHWLGLLDSRDISSCCASSRHHISIIFDTLVFKAPHHLGPTLILSKRFSTLSVRRYSKSLCHGHRWLCQIQQHLISWSADDRYDGFNWNTSWCVKVQRGCCRPRRQRKVARRGRVAEWYLSSFGGSSCPTSDLCRRTQYVHGKFVGVGLFQAVDPVFQKICVLTSIRLLSEIHLTSVVCASLQWVAHSSQHDSLYCAHVVSYYALLGDHSQQSQTICPAFSSRTTSYSPQ
jgi:hypothetical protein